MRRYLFIYLNFLAAALVFPQNKELETVATVRLTKTEAITVKQLKNEVDTLEKATGRSLNAEERREVLNSMINQRLALQAADRDHVTVSDSEVNQRINETKSQLAAQLGRAPSDSEFADAIKRQTGMDLPSFREQYRKQLVVQKYLLEKKRDLFQNTKPPTDDEIKKFYSKNSSEFVQPETVEFSVIIVPWKTDSEKASARSEANKLSKEIGGNASTFDEKVLQGRVPNVSYRAAANQLLQRNSKQWPDSFLDTVFNLEQGKVSSLIEVNTDMVKGFFIIKATGKYPQKLLGIDDVILNVPPEWQVQLQGRPLTVRMYIQEGLSVQKQQEVVLKAQEELIAELRKGNPFSVVEQNLNF
ncbi:MAG: peptidyl-prolyl cis-trans isomerase [Spirochaetaceae bacterium]|jgi:parvulin-like peptidyl-prolyl isomerase|nr:peptidyl-prolyl cis-trans isomerase [Spirochaetaceae bacterium]GMO29407.1 MAG: hypothetical protein Pg6A_17530 [Termitinemataceae bacterium]